MRHGGRIFEIQVVRGLGIHQLQGERGLAALTRADQCDHAAPAEGCSHAHQKLGAFHDGDIVPRKSKVLILNFNEEIDETLSEGDGHLSLAKTGADRFVVNCDTCFASLHPLSVV